jgi:hypothetical protein
MSNSSRNRSQQISTSADRYYREDGTLLSTVGGDTYTSLVEHVESSGHPIPRNGKDWEGDIGGPFFHTKVEARSNGDLPIIVQPPSSVIHGQRLVGSAHIYNAAGIATRVALSASDGANLNDSAINALGTTAISRCEPTSPLVSTAAALGELRRDGLPSQKIATLQARNQRLKAAGNDYLNYEFGWAPFISDIHDLCYAVRHSHEIVSQYRKQANKLIHRRYNFPIERSSSSSVLSSNAKPQGPHQKNSFWNTQGGPVHRDYTVTKRTWFSGAFVVVMPLDDSQLSKLRRHYQQANHLLGIAPTPDAVWETTPWSWLADWFSNTGDIMSNLRAFLFDGLVMKYGYMMSEVKVEDNITLIGTRWADGSTTSPSLNITRLSQKRLPATPFGFGLSWDAFTPRQLAILASLGITRSGKVAK